MTATIFETEVCSRCGGTGRFSHNGEHDRCYKCDGKNGCRSLTKRGAAARAWFDARMTVEPQDVKVGDMIRTRGVKQLTVSSITEKKSGEVINTRTGERTPIVFYVFENAKGFQAAVQKTAKPSDPRSPWAIRRVLQQAELDEVIAEALAYQETLTKAGKPRKRA